MLVDPADLALEYAIDPKPAEIRANRPDEASAEEIVARVIVRNGERQGEILLNLFATILINLKRRLDMQIPLVGSGYDVREVWPPGTASAAAPPAPATSPSDR
jgi:flagellar assembly factor FliW